MTQEERAVKLAELSETANGLVKSYNEAMQENKITEAASLDKTLTQTVNEYTSMVREMCFEECKATEDPMLAAVTMLQFATIRIKDEKPEGTLIAVRSIEETEKQIPLLKLQKYCGSIGASPNWAHIAQKMNMLLTAQKAVDLGIDPKRVNDSFSMSEIARGIDMGKTPTSNTNLLKTLQTGIDAMLGEGKFKVTSHDVNYLVSVFSRKSNKAALTVQCSNHARFVGYMADVCHRCVTGKSYELAYQQKKDNG
jgi:hypothetical protein